jgi:hypothetical protein
MCIIKQKFQYHYYFIVLYAYDNIKILCIVNQYTAYISLFHFQSLKYSIVKL